MKYEIIYKKVKNGYARIQPDGTVLITIPRLLRYNKKFEAELISQAKKIRAKHQKRQQIDALTRTSLQIFGEEIRLSDIDFTRFINPKTQKAKQKNKTIYDMFFQETLLEYIQPLVEKYANMIGYNYQNIKIKKVKSKRGSCSYDQKLVFNQQLVHLSTRLIIYVVVHEVCHLKEKNHSANFRKLVEGFLPGYKKLKKELRQLKIVSV